MLRFGEGVMGTGKGDLRMERYRGYSVEPVPRETRDGRWSVAVRIGAAIAAQERTTYYADDGIAYVLWEEARNESINLARRLIDRGLVR